MSAYERWALFAVFQRQDQLGVVNDFLDILRPALLLVPADILDDISFQIPQAVLVTKLGGLGGHQAVMIPADLLILGVGFHKMNIRWGVSWDTRKAIP